MADDVDAFEQYLREFQPRRPTRPLPASPSRGRPAPLSFVSAAVLLAALAAALVSLTQGSREATDRRTPEHIDAQAREVEAVVTAGRLTRAALESSRNVEDVLASATPATLVRVERAEGPLHSLARE